MQHADIPHNLKVSLMGSSGEQSTINKEVDDLVNARLEAKGGAIYLRGKFENNYYRKKGTVDGSRWSLQCEFQDDILKHVRKASNQKYDIDYSIEKCVIDERNDLDNEPWNLSHYEAIDYDLVVRLVWKQKLGNETLKFIDVEPI